jgi:uncharacterized phage protein (TIGR01671 family)
MKREIKFRIWDKSNKKWKHPDDHKFGVKLTDNGFEFSTGYDSYDSPTFGKYHNELSEEDYRERQEQFEIIQFTGLLDSNGKEIYEGDICKTTGYTGIVEYEIQAGQYWVKWHRNGNRYMPLANGSDQYGDETGIYLNQFEVIGNIYENPELLK